MLAQTYIVNKISYTNMNKKAQLNPVIMLGWVFFIVGLICLAQYINLAFGNGMFFQSATHNTEDIDLLRGGYWFIAALGSLIVAFIIKYNQ